MPKLTDSERTEFLAAPSILMRIACVRADGSPLITPIWFIYQNNAIYFTPRAQSEWLACLRHENRIGLCIDEQDLHYRKVIIEVRAELLYDIGEDTEWSDLYRRIAGRYIRTEAADSYVQNTIDQKRALWRVTLANSSVKSWRMPLDNEPANGCLLYTSDAADE